MQETLGLVFLIIIMISVAGLIASFVCNLAKDALNSAFPEQYEDVKLFFGEAKEKFTARMVTAGNMQFRGFYATVYVFENAIIIRHMTRAVIIKDKTKLKLSGAIVSTLTVESELAPLKLTLGIKEYEIIKEFLEANNG